MAMTTSLGRVDLIHMIISCRPTCQIGASGLNLQNMQFDQYLLQLVRGFLKGSFIVHSHRDYDTANQLQQRSFADSAPSKGGRTPATSGLCEVIMIGGLLWEQRSSILTVYQWLMCLEPDPGDLERTDGGSMAEKQPASGLDPDQAPSSRTPDLWMLKWLQTPSPASTGQHAERCAHHSRLPGEQRQDRPSPRRLPGDHVGLAPFPFRKLASCSTGLPRSLPPSSGRFSTPFAKIACGQKRCTDMSCPTRKCESSASLLSVCRWRISFV